MAGRREEDACFEISICIATAQLADCAAALGAHLRDGHRPAPDAAALTPATQEQEEAQNALGATAPPFAGPGRVVAYRMRKSRTISRVSTVT